MPGVIDMRCEPNSAGVVEIDGKQLSQWLPWHFDHCYNNELNRAGVLRALEIPPEGGMTGFADCIALYDAVSPEIRRQDRGTEHRLHARSRLLQHALRQAEDVPRDRAASRPPQDDRACEDSAAGDPSCRLDARDREKVLHVSPWMAVAIEGQENAEGDALLAAVCNEILDKVRPYFHRWKPTDMLIWDNWRVLHSVSGHDPKYPRRMQRTTIKGDYGLGYFENNRTGDKLLEMTV